MALEILEAAIAGTSHLFLSQHPTQQDHTAQVDIKHMELQADTNRLDTKQLDLLAVTKQLEFRLDTTQLDLLAATNRSLIHLVHFRLQELLAQALARRVHQTTLF